MALGVPTPSGNTPMGFPGYSRATHGLPPQVYIKYSIDRQNRPHHVHDQVHNRDCMLCAEEYRARKNEK